MFWLRNKKNNFPLSTLEIFGLHSHPIETFLFVFIFQFAWLPFERKTPPKEPFLQGDGFDIYIDACRYLPDSVTFSKVRI